MTMTNKQIRILMGLVKEYSRGVVALHHLPTGADPKHRSVRVGHLNQTEKALRAFAKDPSTWPQTPTHTSVISVTELNWTSALPCSGGPFGPTENSSPASPAPSA